MAISMLAVQQRVDPGSEGGAGYDFQWHIAARLCIDMLADRAIDYVVCEFHEDVVQVRRGLALDLIQIKKKDAGSWTLQSLITPERKQRQGILAKLFDPIQRGKEVCSLKLLGCGRISGTEECSLPELIGLLSLPQHGRNADWEFCIQRYIAFLSDVLRDQGIDQSSVERAVRILGVDFSLPNPESIESSNRDFLHKVLHSIWNIELTVPELEQLYAALHSRIRRVSVRPQQPWDKKAVSRLEAIDIATSVVKELPVSGSRHQLLTTQEKLTSVGMSSKIMYALQHRLDAMQLRFEVDIGSSQWENFRTEIDKRWRAFREIYPEIQGPELWQALRSIFTDLGRDWSHIDGRFSSEFAEGVFFDMTGTCEAQWRVAA